MGKTNGLNPGVAIITSAYIMIIGSFVPIPGATGGLEYGFVQFYGNFFTGSILSATMLVWRFITYYCGIIAGAIIPVPIAAIKAFVISLASFMKSNNLRVPSFACLVKGMLP